jgi:hypothetical protein
MYDQLVKDQKYCIALKGNRKNHPDRNDMPEQYALNNAFRIAGSLCIFPSASVKLKQEVTFALSLLHLTNVKSTTIV